MTFRVRLDIGISVLLFVAIFAGFQGGRYFMANRLQELGILSALTVFVLGAWVAAFRIPKREWTRWVYTPCVLIGGVMLVWASTFALKFDERVLYSVLASREFMLGFTGPAMYLIVRAGYDFHRLQRVVWAALLALLVNYLFFYNTLDLSAAFFSSDHTVSNLVTYDPWRGFRLKPPTFAMMLSILAGMMLLLQGGGTARVLFGVVLVGIAAYIWSIVLFRSTLATMLLSILVYLGFFSRRSRLPLVLLLAPLGLLALPIVSQVALEHFANADGGSLRLKSYMVALSHIPSHFLLGIGEDNAYGKSYQQLFGRTFYPSDLGIIGVFFKYGVIGISLYLTVHFTIAYRLWRTNLAVRAADGRHDPILWALLVFTMAQTFNMPLNPGLALAPGITAGTLAFAWSALQQLRIGQLRTQSATPLEAPAHA